MAQYNHVLIIGGGITGCAIAYNLAKQGTHVTLLEQNEICSGISCATSGFLAMRENFPRPYADLAWRSYENYKTLSADLNADFEYRILGGLWPLYTKEALHAAQINAAHQQAAGYDLRLLSPSEALEKEPLMNPKIYGALYTPYDAMLNPFLLVQAYRNAAVRYGAKVHTFTRVTNLLTKGQHVIGVATDSKDFYADLVLCCAGHGCNDLAIMAGCHLPLRVERGYFLVSERLPPLLTHILFSAAQAKSGNIIFGSIHEPTELLDRNIYLQEIRRIAQNAQRDVPHLKKVKVIRTFSGNRCIPQDGLPIIGPFSQFENLWVAVTHSAFRHSAELGPLVARLITGEQSLADIPWFTFTRFQV